MKIAFRTDATSQINTEHFMRCMTQFYCGMPSAWLENKRIFERHSKPEEIPRWLAQGIPPHKVFWKEIHFRHKQVAPQILT